MAYRCLLHFMLLYFPGGILSVGNDHADVGAQLLNLSYFQEWQFLPKCSGDCMSWEFCVADFDLHVISIAISLRYNMVNISGIFS